MKSVKANSGYLRRHNRQLLLNAVYSGVADSRAALAQLTGLAKPTVSDLIGELMAAGLLVEVGLGQSSEIGGKPPILLEFAPDARQIIGVSIKPDKVLGVLTNLEGVVSAEHYLDLTESSFAALLETLQGVINALIVQLDAPLLCIGVGVPGQTDTVSFNETLEPSTLARQLEKQYHIAVYVSSSTQLVARAEGALNAEEKTQNLVTLVINQGVEIGLLLGGTAYQGGGDIGCLQVFALPATHELQRLESCLGWKAVKGRVQALKQHYPQSMLPNEGLSYLHIRHAVANGDPLALQLQAELEDHLAQIFAWIIALLQPDQISLAGSMSNMGNTLLHNSAAKIGGLLPPERVAKVTFALADSENLVAVGAVVHALQHELGLNLSTTPE